MTARLFGAVLMLCLSLPWGGALARDLKIIFYQFTPPYVFERGDGITVDIVRSSLEPQGYEVVPVFVPMGRGFELFAEKRLDGVTIVRDGSGLDGHYSDVFVQYHNHAFALKPRGLKLRNVDDLFGLTILAFQNASKFLDPEFTRVTAGNPNYREVADQETQVLMLLMGRADVAVMDESIFRFYREKLISEGKVSRSVEYEVFSLFSPTPYKTAFTDATVRDDFNRGLAALRASGGYDAIYRKYIDRYFEVQK
jgi:polar amino acid transport system substrate-binding protein